MPKNYKTSPKRWIKNACGTTGVYAYWHDTVDTVMARAEAKHGAPPPARDADAITRVEQALEDMGCPPALQYIRQEQERYSRWWESCPGGRMRWAHQVANIIADGEDVYLTDRAKAELSVAAPNEEAAREIIQSPDTTSSFGIARVYPPYCKSNIRMCPQKVEIVELVKTEPPGSWDRNVTHPRFTFRCVVYCRSEDPLNWAFVGDEGGIWLHPETFAFNLYQFRPRNAIPRCKP